MFNGDEAGFQLEPNPKSVKLIVPTGIDDVFMVKQKNCKRSVTVLATFSASGEALTPFFVYPYERVPAAIRTNMPDGE